MAKKPTTKRGEISQAQSRIMIIVSVATIVTVFCLASSKALLSQAGYQRRLVNAQKASVKQLTANESAAKTLVDQYNNVFLDPNGATNIIGGRNDKSANAVAPDGDNARVVLNALPTTYDFAGLISSVAKIMSLNSITSPNITGTDDSAAASSTPSANPEPVQIKLSISGQGKYDNVKNLIKDFERSIRPFDVTNLQLNGTNNSMSFTAQLSTYYQPAKTLDTVTKKVQ